MEREVRAKLSPPWFTFVSMLNMMFGEDKDINIKYEDDLYSVKIYVNDADKAEALNRILHWKKDYGNITLKINIIPPNIECVKKEWKDTQLIYDTAFKNNPVFSFTKSIRGLFNNQITYVVFKNKVVQFFNDDLNDIYGNMTTLYENIAREIFNSELNSNKGVVYCTDLPEGLKKPLGEWP